ncbi:hypothetical protein RJ142_CDS0003 [Klebsiella phage EKq1]|nr:hypothetical protein RJ142_CDS0003 [Klebsiella phage EKq1]
MTKVLNFTSVAAAPVSERLACGLLDSGCVSGLEISREIKKEIALLRADQHVKIKAGSLFAVVADHDFKAKKLQQALNDYDDLSRAKQQADEARQELIVKLSEWEVFGLDMLEHQFKSLPVVNLKPEEKRQRIEFNIAEAMRQLEEATNFILEKKQVISSMQRIIDGLHEEVASLKKHNDEVVHLNRSQADEIALLNKANESLNKTVGVVVRQRDELCSKLGNARLEIADLKRRLDGESSRSAALTNDAKAIAEQRDEAATHLVKAKSEIASYQRLVEDLKAGTAVDRDTVKRQEETIQRLYGMLNDWHDWATDVIGSPSSMGVEAQRTAISEAMKKRQARIDGQDSAIRAISYQRDSWLQWAKQFTGTDKASCSELLELVKAEVSSREKAFYNNGYLAGKIAASKPKSHDTWSIKTDGPAVMNGTVKVGGVAARAGAMIENAVVMSRSIQASKVTFSDEMKAAIREVVQAVMDEALKQSIQNEIKKLLK